MDTAAWPLCLYLAYLLKKRGNLNVFDQALSVFPLLFWFRHLSHTLYGNSGPAPFLISLVLSGFIGFVAFWRLDLIKSAVVADKAKEDELGPYPIFLDKDKNHAITTTWLTEHVQVIGKSGSGKTASYFLNAVNQSIHQGRGSFYFDSKSSELSKIAFYCKDAGRNKDLKVLDLRGVDRSNTYNPFYKFTKNADGEVVPDSDAVSNIVGGSLFFDHQGEPFYRDMGKEILRNLTGLFHKEFPVITYMDYYTALNTEISTFKSIEALCEKYQGSNEANYFQNQWLTLSIQERTRLLSGLIARLSRFVTTKWAPLVNTRNPQITIANVFDKNQIFYFGAASLINPDDYKPLLVAMFYDIMNETGKRYEFKDKVIPFDLYLDEFYNVAYEGFINLLNKCREAKVPIHLGHQSLGDLTSISKSFATQVADSTNSKIIFRINSPGTADEFAMLIGTKMADPKYVRSLKTNVGPLGMRQEAGVTEKEEEEFILHPNIFKRLDKGQAIVYLAYDKGVTQDIIKFDKAPEPPSSFDLSDVVPLKENHRNHSEASLPFEYVPEYKTPRMEIHEVEAQTPIQEGKKELKMDELKKLERDMKLKGFSGTKKVYTKKESNEKGSKTQAS